MDFGVHLPLLDFERKGYSLDRLQSYAETAQKLGYKAIAANDHMVFSRPWLDGLTALTSVIDKTGDMALMTTIALPVIRRPVALAKALAAIDLLSGGRVIAGVGPGSSARDYEAVGASFEERWQRLDESIQAMRSLWNPDAPPFIGQFYDTQDIRMEPRAARKSGPPIWIGSWGSEAGLRRVARLGDGWLASGYNTTPSRFASALEKLREQLAKHGKNAESFPNAIATMWFFVTDDRAEAEHMLRDVLTPTLRRDEDELRARLPIGPPDACAQKLAAYRDAGRILLWPLANEVEQITRFMEQVVPLLDS